MDWEAIGAIGEILSAVGVIVTLGYLAVQIRHSNKLATWETHQSSVTANANTLNAIMIDPGVAKIYRTGFMDPDQLDEVEKIRFNQLVTQMVLNFKDILDAYDKGMFDFPTYQAWQGYLCSHLNMPGGKRWWNDYHSGFIQRVRDEVNQGMLEVPRADAQSPTFWSSDAEFNVEVLNPRRSTWTNASGSNSHS